MRVLKPLYVSPLVGPYDDGRRIHCIIAAIVHVSFSGELLKEQDLWRYACEETEGMVLDECKAKPYGEWLVHGSCYARKPGVGMSFVKATVGAQEKVLAVFGPRTWTSGGPSTPQPFDVVPIRFTRAFGGPTFPDNPTGTGYGDTPPPQVEVRGSFVTTPRDKPPVAGFGRLDPTLPARMKKMGTYDEKWMKTRFPGMAEDFDATYFHFAPPDQRRDRFFDGTEAFSFVNMHPELEVVGGKLPGMTGRAFVKRKGEDAMIDVRMHIDTVHFYPHRQTVALVCRGATRTNSSTLADIEEIGLAVEWMDRPKSFDHYMAAFAVKRDRRAGFKRLDDTPLVPEGNPAPAPKERIRPPGAGLVQRQMERRGDTVKARVREKLVAQGADPSELDKVPTHIDTSVDPDDVPEHQGPLPTVEGVQQQVAEATKAKMAELREKIQAAAPDHAEGARATIDQTEEEIVAGPIGPPKFGRAKLVAKFQKMAEELRARGGDTSFLEAQFLDPKLVGQMDEFERFQCESYRTTVQYQRRAPRLDPEASTAARARAVEMVRRGEPFAYVDFSGADLSRLDLRGARMSRAFLESADLTGANLEGAELDHAVLARATLTGTDPSTCRSLAGANFSGAEVRGVNLSGHDLTGSFFHGTDLTGTRLTWTKLDKADFTKAILRDTDLSESKGTNLLLHKLRLEGVVLRGAKWERPLFYETELVKVDFRGAEIPKLAIVDTIAEECIFDDAILLKLRAARAMGTTAIRRCSFVGTIGHKAFFRGLDMHGSNFRHADMKESDFSEAILDDSDFQDARLVGARFMSAGIRRCRFDRADLMEALLTDALMDHSTFEGANLFRADLLQAGGEAVDMRGANVKRVRTGPKREEAL